MLSSFIALSGCGEDSPVNELTDLNPTFNLAVIDNVSEPSADGLRTISMTFTDKEGNELKMNAISGFRHLEAGYYEIDASADDRLEASVSLTSGGKAVAVEGGSVYVRKRNYEYDLKWDLKTAQGVVTCTANGKYLYFETDTFDKLTSGGTGTLLTDLTIKSEHLNSVMKYSVLLPAGYDEKKEYPVLYILHGMWGDNNDWMKEGANGGAMNAYLSEFIEDGGTEMIIVSPEGKNLFYCNGYEHGMNYMSYFFNEFVPFIENEYSIRSERGSRAIGGLSMGGYGSLYYGLLHPEMFCHVYACSSAVSVGGAAPDLTQFLAAASSEGRIADLPELTLEIGTEDILFANNEAFIKTLNGYNVAYEYITRTGIHDWHFWNICAPKILRKTAACFEK